MKEMNKENIPIGWIYNENHLEKQVVFSDFREAMSQMIRIGFIAEELNHHPEWTNVYNKLHIKLRTHDTNSVTDKDIELALRINKCLN